VSPELHTPPLPVTHVWVGYHWQNNGLPPAYAVVTNTCTTSCRTLTIKLTSHDQTSSNAIEKYKTLLAVPSRKKRPLVVVRCSALLGKSVHHGNLVSIQMTPTQISSTQSQMRSLGLFGALPQSNLCFHRLGYRPYLHHRLDYRGPSRAILLNCASSISAQLIK